MICSASPPISAVQYRGGIANYLQVITAQTSALQNQRGAVDILTRRTVTSVSLIQALGGWDASQLRSSQDMKRCANGSGAELAVSGNAGVPTG